MKSKFFDRLSLSVNQAQEAIDQHFRTLNKDHPFYEAKQRAREIFNQRGFPHIKDENYRHTPITNALAGIFDFSQPSTPSKLPKEAILPLLHQEMDTYQLVIINGRMSREYSKLGNAKKNWQVLSFTEADRQHQNLCFQHWRQSQFQAVDAFTTLNTALFEEGIVVYIADQAVLEKPLSIYHITDTKTSPSLSYPRLLIVAGQDSQANLITSWHIVGQSPGFTNAVTEIILAKNAQIDHYTLQTKMGPAYQVNTIRCYQASQSLLNNYTLTWDGALVRNNLDAYIQGSHSAVNMYGLYCLNAQQHLDNHTLVDHRVPHTKSNELYQGILAGEASSVFNGRIVVQPEAQKTQAFQANNNLLLTEQAKVHAKPQLEIWADDVKCSHGATTGQLDQDQLFYLRARGIPADTAHSMLLHAFASKVLEKIPILILKRYLSQALEAKLRMMDLDSIGN